ncbi:MAG: hypothetical protein ACRC1K_18505, partial [Planctomycetia bacterium]
GDGPYRTDGTAAGTVKVSSLNPAARLQNTGNLASFNNGVVFSGNNAGMQGLFSAADPTQTGTLLRMFAAEPGRFLAIGSTLFFVADDGATGAELWRLVVTPDVPPPGPGPNPTPTNNAPTLVVSSTPSTAAVRRAIVGRSGIKISRLLGAARPRDGRATSDDPGSRRGVALTQLSNQGGRWQFRLGNGAWRTVRSGSLSTRRSLLLRDGDSLRFVGTGGRVRMQYAAWDQTTGRAGGFASTAVRGGSTAFSTARRTYSLGTVRPAATAGVGLAAAVEAADRKSALSAAAIDLAWTTAVDD